MPEEEGRPLGPIKPAYPVGDDRPIKDWVGDIEVIDDPE